MSVLQHLRQAASPLQENVAALKPAWRKQAQAVLQQFGEPAVQQMLRALVLWHQRNQRAAALKVFTRHRKLLAAMWDAKSLPSTLYRGIQVMNQPPEVSRYTYSSSVQRPVSSWAKTSGCSP